MQVEIIQLVDDGKVPNSTLPLVLYRGVFRDGTTANNAIERFAANGWYGAWVNGIFGYHHYHAQAHEVLANLGDMVMVQFGGAVGPIVEFAGGDAVVIPAGGGHCRLSAGAGLEIVGAYPEGQENWDLKRAASQSDYESAITEIPLVERPPSDPLLGRDGPLLLHW